MINLSLENKNFYVAIDFDKTITSYKSPDSWASVAQTKFVGQEIVKEMDELYEKYRPIEMDYSIGTNDKQIYMKKWYEDCMDLYHKYNLTEQKMHQSIQSSNMYFRSGAKEFLELMYKNNIPVVILSAGIGNAIKQFLNDNNCLSENMYIISNFIEFDKNGKAKKFDNSKIIHTLNKNMKGHLPKEFEEKLVDKKYRLLVGDLIEDIKMVDENELDKTLKIGFLEDNIENNLEIYKKYFDVVLQGEEATFYQIVKLFC